MALPADLGVRDTVGDAVPRGDKEGAARRGHVGERPSVWGRGLEALRPGAEPLQPGRMQGGKSVGLGPRPGTVDIGGSSVSPAPALAFKSTK